MMDQRLHEAFRSGLLLPPNADVPNFAHLVQAVAWLTGAADNPGDPQAKQLAEQIGQAEHLVLVLVDGMGMSMIDRLPEDSMLRRRLITEMRAVFPSTTSCAITAICTGMWPGQHGVPGWWAYLDERNLSATCLPFVERYSGRPLTNWGVRLEELWPHPAIMKRMRHEPMAVVPAAIADTIFSRYFRGERGSFGYQSIVQAIDAAVRRAEQAKKPSYTYVYFPELDATCHTHGTDSAQALHILQHIGRELERLVRLVEGRCRIIITADHGQLNVSEEDHLGLQHHDPLLDLLEAPPTGEPRMPIFHVKPNRRREFEQTFHKRFSEPFVLLPTEAAEELRLLGPPPLSPLARRRFGQYLGIALAPATLHYFPAGQPSKAGYIGYHGGLSPHEMRIPLILM